MRYGDDFTCEKCGEPAEIDGDPPKVWAWCGVCDDYATGFDEGEWTADYFAGIADSMADAYRDGDL